MEGANHLAQISGSIYPGNNTSMYPTNYSKESACPVNQHPNNQPINIPNNHPINNQPINNPSNQPINHPNNQPNNNPKDSLDMRMLLLQQSKQSSQSNGNTPSQQDAHLPSYPGNHGNYLDHQLYQRQIDLSHLQQTNKGNPNINSEPIKSEQMTDFRSYNTQPASSDKYPPGYPSGGMKVECKPELNLSTKYSQKKADKPKIGVKIDEIDPAIAPPPCDCPGDPRDGAPAYCHLGCAPTFEALRENLENRYDLSGEALKITEIFWTGREAKSKDGCPVVQDVLQRTSLAEQVLVVARKRSGHYCQSTVQVVLLVAWDGVPEETASDIYATLAATLPFDGVPTQRQCDKNQSKTCVCQGSPETGGACYSFGCSWSVYFNGCKFARSKNPKKFKLDDKSPTYDIKKEEQLELMMQALATDLAPVYETLAPKAYSNQVSTQEDGSECRIGLGKHRPFSGITACLDFSAHNHRDKHNISSGVTMVVTLTKHKKQTGTDPHAEQIHSLPLYGLSHKGEGYCMSYPPEVFTDINVPAPQPVPPAMFQHNTPTGVQFDEMGYIQCIRKQEEDFKASVAAAKKNLGPPRYVECGGVGIVPTHGSVILEHALRELHVTTPLPRPYRYHPTRIALILYQHKNLCLRQHGYKENEEKMKSRDQEKRENQLREDFDKNLHHEIEKAKRRSEEEEKAQETFMIPPGLIERCSQPPNWVRQGDRQNCMTTPTLTASQSLPYLYTVGPYQQLNTSPPCKNCADIFQSTTPIKQEDCTHDKGKATARKIEGDKTAARKAESDKPGPTKRQKFSSEGESSKRENIEKTLIQQWEELIAYRNQQNHPSFPPPPQFHPENLNQFAMHPSNQQRYHPQLQGPEKRQPAFPIQNLPSPQNLPNPQNLPIPHDSNLATRGPLPPMNMPAFAMPQYAASTTTSNNLPRLSPAPNLSEVVPQSSNPTSEVSSGVNNLR